ncbi:MAG: response regulator, partial [Lachnospiraceae bacterium]|nr:response regulator [Lachnospiraceae bacterium]
MKKVLVVDDMQTVLDQAKELLKGIFEVNTALSTSEALKLMEEDIPDIILCDINMPDTDGFALLDSIRKTDGLKDIPVIFMVI